MTNLALWRLSIPNNDKVIGLTTRYDAGFGRHTDKAYVLEYEENE